ncbi:hypothetical protein [Streptomyces sp. NPDC000878]
MASIPNDVAVADMRRDGDAEPQEPYPGHARARWKCQCNRCKKIIYPNRNNVKSGQGACRHCAPNTPVDPAAAAAVMFEHGFRALLDFPGTGKPWLSLCTAADHLVSPRYDNVTGRDGGCRFCKRYGPGDPEEAVRDMEAAGFKPLEPFTNIRSRWESLCDRCGKISRPNLNNVRTRGACCSHCARYGLNPGAPARLYVLKHLSHGAVKIGITGLKTREDRVARFCGMGWTVVDTLPFETGEAAYKIEQAVIGVLRSEGLSSFLQAEQMPTGGWTETFDAALVSASRLWELTQAELGP